MTNGANVRIIIQLKLARGLGKNRKPPFWGGLVPLTELFSNSFMDDLDMIWGLRSIIPDPTTPPVLYRNPDAEDIV